MLCVRAAILVLVGAVAPEQSAQLGTELFPHKTVDNEVYAS